MATLAHATGAAAPQQTISRADLLRVVKIDAGISKSVEASSAAMASAHTCSALTVMTVLVCAFFAVESQGWVRGVCVLGILLSVWLFVDQRLVLRRARKRLQRDRADRKRLQAMFIEYAPRGDHVAAIVATRLHLRLQEADRRVGVAGHWGASDAV